MGLRDGGDNSVGAFFDETFFRVTEIMSGRPRHVRDEKYRENGCCNYRGEEGFLDIASVLKLSFVNSFDGDNLIYDLRYFPLSVPMTTTHQPRNNHPLSVPMTTTHQPPTTSRPPTSPITRLYFPVQHHSSYSLRVARFFFPLEEFLYVEQ